MENEPSREKITVQDIVEDVVKRIQDKQFSPGRPIREAELCELYGVSRTPIREALRLLQNIGVVVYIPRCGVQVVDITTEDLDYITSTRTVLEALCAGEAALKITAEEIEELRGINRQLESAAPEELSTLDIAFHSRIAGISGNRYAAEFLRGLILRLAISRSRIPMRAERVPYSCAEHEALIRALEMHDPVLAEKQAEIHFRISQKMLETKHEAYMKEHK